MSLALTLKYLDVRPFDDGMMIDGYSHALSLATVTRDQRILPTAINLNSI